MAPQRARLEPHLIGEAGFITVASTWWTMDGNLGDLGHSLVHGYAWSAMLTASIYGYTRLPAAHNRSMLSVSLRDLTATRLRGDDSSS